MFGYLARLFCLPFFAVMLFAFASCAPGSSLRLASTDLPLDDGRRYRLLLYGGMDFNDFEIMAVMDREDDRFLLVSHAGEHRLRTLEGLTMAEAREEARRFLGRNNYFHDLEPRVIIGPDGQPLGYEIRGSYSPSAGRRGDDLDSTYLLGPDNTVIFYIYYPPEVGRDAESSPILSDH